MEVKKYKCKYCGVMSTHKETCGNCAMKLRYIRKIKQMVKDTFERYGKGDVK